jgi:hypothetical protein
MNKEKNQFDEKMVNGFMELSQFSIDQEYVYEKKKRMETK